MTKELFITGAGVSAESGVPTFRGTEGLWTVGSKNYTPQEMATRTMYKNNPDEFLLWYFARFASLQDVKPNFAHFWLSDKLLITQNIDGLDGKAGNTRYIPIHGRLDKLVVYDSQDKIQNPFNAMWDDIKKYTKNTDERLLRKALLTKCKIKKNNFSNTYTPLKGTSLKPFVLLFDEYYTENYRISEAMYWMETAAKIVFIGTSFSVNITNIALEIAMKNNIPIEIVDPKPIKLNYSNIKYHELTAIKYCQYRSN
jgi:NAD-dependent deacetylase